MLFWPKPFWDIIFWSTPTLLGCTLDCPAAQWCPALDLEGDLPVSMTLKIAVHNVISVRPLWVLFFLTVKILFVKKLMKSLPVKVKSTTELWLFVTHSSLCCASQHQRALLCAAMHQLTNNLIASSFPDEDSLHQSYTAIIYSMPQFHAL